MQYTGKIHKRLPSILFRSALFFVVLLSVTLLAQEDKKKLQSRKSILEREISETNKELEQTKKNKTANLNQLILINKKINKREELIQELGTEVNSIESQIYRLNDTINRINRNLSELKSEYAKLVYSTFRNRSAVNRLMFIFASQSFNQAYKRIKYLRQYTDYRKAQVIEITEKQRLVATKKLELENTKSSKLSLKHQQEGERNNLAEEKQEKDNKIKNLTSQEKKLLGKLRDNEAALRKLQVSIESLVASEIKKANEEKAKKAEALAEKTRKAEALADRNAKAEAAKNAKPTASKAEPPKPAPTEKTISPSPVVSKPATSVAKPTTANSNSMSITAEDFALSGSFASNKGRLPSPVDKGSIISSFGEHPHPEFQNIKVKNNGIDILSSPGAPVKSVFEGEVSSTMFIANLNYVVIVRHGDYLTVYSNLNNITVKKGDKIKTRQVLGTAATEENGTKSRLHYEMWMGTILLNPSVWLNM